MIRQIPAFSRPLIIPLLVTTGLSQIAVAQSVDNRPAIHGGASWFEMDVKRDIDDDNGFYVGGEIPLTERWSGTLELWQNDSYLENLPMETDNRYTRIGGNYHLNLHSRWQPYLAAGIGHMETDFEHAGTAGDTALDFGVGIKRFFTDNLFLRGDAKVLLGEGGADDLLFGISIGYAFGARSSGASPTPAPADSDGDGVVDDRDRCPGTRPGAEVDERGCESENERDSDRDGVADSRDRCPDTDPDHAVDNRGCVIIDVVELRQELEVRFDTDQHEVTPGYDGVIRDFADFMDRYGDSSAYIEGHTDSDGTEDYNQDLSERRAQAVVDVLVEDHDIREERLNAVGYGESRPVADNNTAQGKAQNRRTVGVVEVEVERERERED